MGKAYLCIAETIGTAQKSLSIRLDFHPKICYNLFVNKNEAFPEWGTSFFAFI
jgi:hypothetical protein